MELTDTVIQLEENIKQPKEKPRFLIRDSTFALKPQPPIDYVVDSLISRGTVSVFYGEPGSKKTYSMLSLAACVSLGKSWLEMETKKSTVLIIDEESGELRLARRIGEVIRGEMGGENADLKFICYGGFLLDDPNDPIILSALIQQLGAGLVIIDALSDIMTGDENLKKDTQPVFTALRKIADDTSAAIIVIHHSNKNGGYRGSSAIKAGVDNLFQVTSSDGSGLIELKTEKVRDGKKTNWAARAVWIGEGDQFYLESVEPRREFQKFSKAQKYVIRYLKENPGAFLQHIEDNADSCTGIAARAAVYQLADRGITRRINTGKHAAYELTDKGQSVNCEEL